MGRTNPNCGQYILIHLMKPFWCTFTLMKVPSLASWASVSLGREINTFSSQVQWSVSQPMLWVALVSSTAFLELFSIFTNSLESKNLEVELLNYCQMTKINPSGKLNLLDSTIMLLFYIWNYLTKKNIFWLRFLKLDL